MYKTKYNIFLIGLFISSLGSNAFVLTVVTLLKSNGVSLGFLGLFVFVSRFSVFLTQNFFGNLGDRISPVKIIVFSELGAFIATILLLLSLDVSGKNLDNKNLFLIFGMLRVFFVSLQLSSTQKIAKYFDDQNQDGGKTASRLAFLSNLALFTMGILSFIFFDKINVGQVLIFDGVTFLINGLLFLHSQKKLKLEINYKVKFISLKSNVVTYFNFSKQCFYKDIFLCLALFGANILNLKLLSDHLNWIPILTTSFGLCGMLASMETLTKYLKNSHNYIWLLLCVSLIGQGLLVNIPIGVLFFAITRNFCYWVLYNTISINIMKLGQLANFAELSSGRSILNLGILSTGEYITGNYTLYSVQIENSIRGFFALMPIGQKNK